ncbi:MAG: universal stress protein [Proteobacteria bacterium]|nr:universal stress protein [Pseudomonadota bacterium]
MDILACVDGSAYAASVCEHAAWLAERLDGRVAVLHAQDGEIPTSEPDKAIWSLRSHDPLEAAKWRLRDLGATQVTGRASPSGFPEAAINAEADLIVMGKHGEATQDIRDALGHSIDAVIRGSTTPVCLAPKVFLPISRGLVLLDADPEHRSALDYLRAHRRLLVRDTSLLVMFAPGQDPQPKMDIARAVLDPQGVDIAAVEAAGIDEAVAMRLETHAADLITIARAVLSPSPEVRLQAIEARGLWGWRTPVLVC